MGHLVAPLQPWWQDEPRGRPQLLRWVSVLPPGEGGKRASECAESTYQNKTAIAKFYGEKPVVSKCSLVDYICTKA
ncbi:MAG: hypothetical protein BJ554DRAFT_6293 [Olpidium bornovanus]|uniref:Uncharacterized protein n=1 Tax=Olpidium bornovanus TaxID=278681 RepID=A0A8H8DM40_9FUNG|nr:MAG: hypothetical protein BJ554DRAFT_6293 [Olpidium bornovanus]